MAALDRIFREKDDAFEDLGLEVLTMLEKTGMLDGYFSVAEGGGLFVGEKGF